MRLDKGFTLIELMIVIAVLGIIVAIALPNYNSYIKRTKRVEVQAYLMELSHKAQNYKLKNQGLNGLTITKIGSANFPISGTSNYDIKIEILNNTRGVPAGYILSAKPQNGKSQSGTGLVTLTSKGEQCWYRNNDNASINSTLDADHNVIPATPCIAAWSDK